jgi:CBS domain-containing protein
MSAESIPVSRFMSTDIITQTEDQNIRAVSRSMYENNIGSLVTVKNKDTDNNICRLVVDEKGNENNDNNMVGIITDKDKVVGIILQHQTWLKHSQNKQQRIRHWNHKSARKS